LELSGGNRRQARRSRIATLALGALAATLVIAGCGDDDDSGSEDERAYEAAVVSAEFPPRQRLGETTRMRLKVRNEGDRTIPSLVVNVSLGGEAGGGSSLPFGIRSEEPGLAAPERPVWVLSEHYPKRGDSDDPGGTEGASPKSFNFGPLPAGRSVDGVWQLNAVRTGRYQVLYGIDGDVGGEARVESPSGDPIRGRFTVTITDSVPDTTVNDRGEVVRIPEPKGADG